MKSILIFAALLLFAAAFSRADANPRVEWATAQDSTPHILKSDSGDTSGADASAGSKFAQDSATAISARAREHFATGKYALAAVELRSALGYVDDIDGRLWLYFAEWKASGNKTASDHLEQYIEQAQRVGALNSPFIEALLSAIQRGTKEEVVFQTINDADPRYHALLTFKANFYLGMNNLLEGAKITARKYWTKCLDSGLSQFSEYHYAMSHMPR